MNTTDKIFKLKDKRKLNVIQSRSLKAFFANRNQSFHESDEPLDDFTKTGSDDHGGHHLKENSHGHGHGDGVHGDGDHDGHGHAKGAHSGGHAGHDDDHHYKEPCIISACGAGLINFLLMFGLCCAYGLIIFGQPGHKKHVGLGIKMCLASAAMLGLVMSCNSKLHIAIGGPDMNAVIFIGGFVEKISEDLAKQLGLDSPGPDDKYFCTDSHLAAHPVECEDYHEQLRATTIFAATVSSLILALLFMIIGACQITRLMTYMPSSIVDAFLSCMGYKVFKYGLKMCKHKPGIFIPSAALGVPLYFIKALHLMKPVIAILLFLFGPVAIFYLVVLIGGFELEKVRKEQWMFEKVYNEDFWEVWTDGACNYRKINFKAWQTTILDLIVMQVVCLLDCLVTALRVTEVKIPDVQLEKNYESLLFGIGGVASACFSGAAGYMQLKLNVINFDILGNTADRRGGMIYAVLCGAIFMSSVEVINYFPRLLLGILLFFSGSGFVAEHLWGSKEYLSNLEWIQVIIIVIIFMFTDEILYSVVAGFILCGFTFIAKYSKIPCIAGAPIHGGELQSREQHAMALTMNLSHIANSWLLVIRLKGYVFFASVQTMTNHVRLLMEEEKDHHLPTYRRVKYIVLDCELLDGLDSSAEKDIQSLMRETKAHGMRILWSNMNRLEPDLMLERGTIESARDWFHSLDDALVYVERLSFCYRKRHQLLWEGIHPSFELYLRLSRLRESFEPFTDVLRLDVERFGIPWDYCEVVKITALESVLWNPGQHLHPLYLVHTGAVGLFHSLPSDYAGIGHVERPIAIYRHGWFLNREFLMGAQTHHYAVALEDGEVLCWTMHEWWRMQREQPLMAAAILESAMRQAATDMERMSRAMRMTSSATDYEVSRQLEKETVDYEAREDESDDDPVQDHHGRKSALSVIHQHDKHKKQKLKRKSSAIRAAKAEMREATTKRTRMQKVEEPLVIPESLETRLECIECTQSLAIHGFYDAIPAGQEGALAPLPEAMKLDLQVTFHTFCQECGADGEPGIEWDKISVALMYAGIFGVLLHEGQREAHPYVNELQFLSLGHEAYMVRLSKRQQLKVYVAFAKHRDKETGMVPCDQMNEVFKKFAPMISEQELYGICTVFDSDNTGYLDLHQFSGAVARYVRRHEQEWNLLRGVRDLLGKVKRNRCHGLDVLTSARLLEYSNQTSNQILTHQEAEEMLWCASCFSKLVSGRNIGKKLDFNALIGALVLNCDMPFGKLPPPPVWPDSDPDSDEEKSKERTKKQETLRAPGTKGTKDATGDDGISSEGKAALNAQLKDGVTENPLQRGKYGNNEGMRAGMIARSATTGKVATKTEQKDADMSPRVKPKGKAFKRAKSLPLTKTPTARIKTLRKKFLEHADAILDACANEACRLTNLSSARTDMTDALVDLRNLEANKAGSEFFGRTRISEVDIGHGHEHVKDKKPKELLDGSEDSPDLKMFYFLNSPETSRGAFLLAVFMGVVVACSVAAMVIKTWFFADSCSQPDHVRQMWRVAECLFTCIFMSELVLRYAVAAANGGSRLAFCYNPLNVCDFISCLPFLVELAIGDDECSTESTETSALGLFRITKLMRLTRVARLYKHSKGDNLFGPTTAVLTLIWGIYVKNSSMK